jgi:hypothetical protein
MFLIGTIASSKFIETDTGAMDPLQVITVGPSGASSIAFTNIPSTYAHLQLRVWGYNGSGSDRSLAFTINDDAGLNYVNHFLIGNGTSPSAGVETGRGQTFIFDANSAQTGFNGDVTKASVFILDILDYSSSNKNKTTRALGGWDGNGAGVVGLGSSLWLNTATINKLNFFLSYSTNFSSGTTIALYGIKGA